MSACRQHFGWSGCLVAAKWAEVSISQGFWWPGRLQQVVMGRQSKGCFNAAAFSQMGVAHPLALPSSAWALWWCDPGAGAEAPASELCLRGASAPG